MTCNGVLTPPSKSNAPQFVTPPLLKLFNSPVVKLFTPPPSDWKWLFLHFTHMATSKQADVSEAIIID